MNTNKHKRKPVVLMTSGAKVYGGVEYQQLGKKYIDPVVRFSGCIPLIYPTAYGVDDVEQYLSMADGIFVSGASSNIDPLLYGQYLETPELPQDRDRDDVDVEIIRMALAKGVPILGVCRGFQEMNVAFGGDLHQVLHETPGFMDHREPKGPNGEELDLDTQYGPNHSVKLVADTWFSELLEKDEFMVNSLHGQGIKTLAPELKALAHAPDGLVEAVTFSDAPQFTLGVQWHPEWKTWQNPLSIKIFAAFGAACQTYADARDTR
mgnify:FL=1